MLAAKYRGLSEGDTGYAASEEASPGIHGLQVVPTTTNSGTDVKAFAAQKQILLRPQAERNPQYSPCLPTMNLASFLMGTGDAKG